LEHIEAHNAQALKPVLVEIYTEVYREHLAEPFYTAEAFALRLDAHVAREGWACILGRVAGDPAGFIYGYPSPGASSWHGLRTEVDPELIKEPSGRTFDLCEFMVRAPWRGTGIAKVLHDELMNSRPEQRCSLLVQQRRPKVRALYERWGYKWAGDMLPADDAPLYNAMILDLKRFNDTE
jgi:GNAT superfamily N-acetyltransferase